MKTGPSKEEIDRFAKDVRSYVRDRFTPGSLDSLNELENWVRSTATVTLTRLEADTNGRKEHATP